MRILVRSVLAVVLLSLAPVTAHPVRGAEHALQILDVGQRDTNGDGSPDVTVVDASFATAHDRITVYDQNGDMRTSTDWREATDFTDDVWVYDIGADGSAQIIVRYAVEDGHDVAYVYDDENGDGAVSYSVSGSRVSIQESPYWTARIVSASDWFRPDGQANLNVKIDLDGPIPTLDRAPDYYIRDFMKHDGTPDVAFEVVAGDDGIASYALRHLLAPSPPDWQFERAWLWSNDGRYPTKANDRAFFPFLPVPIDPQNPADADVRYFDLPPEVAVDWSKGKVTAVKLDGYPIGAGEHFNSNDYIVPGTINNVSFESPQAYYDLAGDGDAFPDMHIRFFTRPADDDAVWSLPTARSEPWQAIGYDWNLFNPRSLRWDFKLSVAGNYTIDSVVHFPDFDIRTIPYDELPDWIMDRDWKLTTFLAREGEGYQSSEGLYEWMADTGDDPEGNPARAVAARDATFGFMQGAADVPPDAFFQSAHVGFRAERHFATAERPSLYFSPVDRKVHLDGAESGIWNLDGQRAIRYDVIGDGRYLNHWQYYLGDDLRRELYVGDGLLLYAGEDELTLKDAQVTPSLFDAVPPRNHDEWQSMQQALLADRPTFAPTDFRAMLGQFPGRAVTISGAIVHDIRATADGVRFVLQLRPGFESDAADTLGLKDRPPGDYVVTSSGGRFTVAPLTPPVLDVSVISHEASALQQNAIRVAVTNTGRGDVPGASLELWATSPDGETTKVGSETVQVLSGLPIAPTFAWAPPSAGLWTLTARVRDPAGQLVTSSPAPISVGTPFPATPRDLASISSQRDVLPLLLAAMLAFGLLVSVIFRRAWASPDQRERR